jgi:hypothetical protein
VDQSGARAVGRESSDVAVRGTAICSSFSGTPQYREMPDVGHLRTLD